MTHITIRNIFTVPLINHRIPPLASFSVTIFSISPSGILSCPPFTIVRSWLLMINLFSVVIVGSDCIFSRISFQNTLFSTSFPGFAFIFSSRSMIYGRFALSVGTNHSMTRLATLISFVA